MAKIAKRIFVYLPILLIALALGSNTFAAPSSSGPISAALDQVKDAPPFHSYKGVSIGMTTEEVREKLGKPKEPSEGMDYYAPSDNEFVQIYYEAKKVTAITVTFSGKIDSAPDSKAVFGESAEAKPDGGIFKMVRYPKAGYWISYNKIAGDDPMVMIAIKKI